VSVLVQNGTAVHNGHASTGPFSRYVPPAHEVHCEFEAELHVSDDVQFVMPVHGTHAVPVALRR